MTSPVDLTIVGPVYKGQETVPFFVEETRKVLESLDLSYEIILVDDGCPNGSWKAIQEECMKHPSVRGVRLSRNFGQQIAVSAGLSLATGTRIIAMDADLQNPSNAIPAILEKLDNGIDIVYTVSRTRNNWTDELTSYLFWFIINRVLGVKMIPNQLMMKGFNRKFLDVFNRYTERVRVVAGITHDIGMQSTILEVNNQRRNSGKGNYNFFQRFNLMVDIVLAITPRPLNFIIHFSILSLIASSFIGAYTIAIYFFYPDVPPGYPTLIALITFFGSMTLLVLGIIGRYLSSIYTEVRERPLFTIQRKLNIEHE
jgi:glycosyltransferase involved in cell wall biosynthesis